MAWNSRLRHPIPLSDSRVLRTLADARDMVSSLPERDQRQDKWQMLANLLTSAAQGENALLTALVTDRIEEVLRRPPFTVVRLAIDIDKKA
jgi:homoserine kinase